MEPKKQDVPKGGFKAKRTLIFGIGTLILLASLSVLWFCKSNNPPKSKTKKMIRQEIFTDFSLNTFSSDIELKLLAELRICDTTRVGDEFGACSPKFFKFFKLF
jgi:hypothetical protein